jgi:hypothetical protein
MPPPAPPPQPVAAPEAPAPVEASAPSPAPTESGVSDVQVLEFRPLFEAALKQGASATELAEHCMRTYGRDNVALILKLITPDRVLTALQNGGFATSPLCRRDGQKFLRETFTILQKRTTAA